MPRLLLALQKWAWRRPRAVLALLAVLCGVSALAASRLHFNSDIVNILPKSSPAVDAVQEVLENFSFTGQLFIFLEKKTPGASDEAAMRIADGIARRMQGAPEVTAVDWKILPESEVFLARMAAERGPLLIPDERSAEFLKRFESAEIRKVVRKNAKRLRSPGVSAADALVPIDPLDLTRDFYLPLLAAGRPQGKFDVSSGYYFSAGRRSLIVMVEGAKPPHDVTFGKKLVALAERAIAEARAEVPGGEDWGASLLGGYPIALFAESSIKKDMGVTIMGSLPPLLVMLLISLRRWLSLLVGALALSLGILWTFGLAGAAYGHLTGVTVGFAGLIAGMGIDFTIHFMNRYRVERDSGLHPEAACAAVYFGGAPSVFVAMVTSAASFLCLWVSKFAGLREFATLVGVGLFFVFAATALVFPVLVRAFASRSWAERDIPRWFHMLLWGGFAAFMAIEVTHVTGLGLATAIACFLLMTGWGQRAVTALVVGKPRISIGLAIAGTAVAAVALLHPPAGMPVRETDVKNLRTEGDVILEIQERMRADFGSGLDPLFVVTRGATEEEALEKAYAVVASISAVPDMAVQGITQFVPPPSLQRRRAAEVAKVDVDRVIKDLDAALDAEGFEVAAFDAARRTLRTALSVRDPILPSQLDDPFFRSIRSRFLASPPGGLVRALIWVTPRDPLHESEVRQRVVNALMAAAKNGDAGASVSGFNVVVKEIDERIGPDIAKATFAAVALSIVLAGILFGSLRWTLLALFPAMVGTLWMLGVFRLMDMKMNYINLIVYPLMMGMGTDNGLYLVYRFRELKRSSVEVTITSLWRGITMTALTTIVGFESLAFASNLAMRSLGVTHSLGMLSYLAATLLVLPPLLKWLEAKGETSPESKPGG
ncbi:MAG: MMPL family transporter [Planctomycetota bacterium]